MGLSCFIKPPSLGIEPIQGVLRLMFFTVSFFFFPEQGPLSLPTLQVTSLSTSLSGAGTRLAMTWLVFFFFSYSCEDTATSNPAGVKHCFVVWVCFVLALQQSWWAWSWRPWKCSGVVSHQVTFLEFTGPAGNLSPLLTSGTIPPPSERHGEYLGFFMAEDSERPSLLQQRGSCHVVLESQS